MNTWITTVRAFVALLLLCATASADSRPPAAIEWLSFDTAQQQDNPIQKKYFIYFFSQQCGYCRMLEEKTFTNNRVISYLNENFVPVRVDTEKEARLANRYRVQGVPDLRFLAADGEAIARWPGYTEADHLLALLKFVHTDSYKQMDFNEFVKSISP
jgi:thioredoxin-related protein